MKKNILFIVSILLLLSCNDFEKKKMERLHDFNQKTWNRFDKLHFSFPIEQKDKGKYGIKFFVKTTDKMTYEMFPFHLILDTPSGEKRVKEFEFPLDSTTQIKGEPQKYMLSIYQNLLVNDTGNLMISIEQLIPKYTTPGFEKAGIVIEQQ